MRKQEGDGLRWHGIRFSYMSAAGAGGLIFVMGVVVLGSLGFSTGWFVAGAVILGVGIVGLTRLVRKMKS